MNGVAKMATHPAAEVAVGRADAEDLLFLEAQLLDEWRLDEWLALLTEDATYDVPTTGAADDVSSSRALFYIADDYARIRYRVARLKGEDAHSEWPRSNSVRQVGNVRILGSGPGGVQVRSAFTTYRSKRDTNDIFFGHHLHTLRWVDGQLKIVAKRTMLDMSSLRPQGRISIIL